MSEPIDITPEDSVAPIYSIEPVEIEDPFSPIDFAEVEAKAMQRASALEKLKLLGLTDEEIDAIISI